MEELLSKLIEKGWKPYGIEKNDIEVCSYDKDRKKISIGYMNWETPSKGDYDWLFLDLRQLTSKESGLRQFVCDNKMQKIRPPYNRYSDTYGFTIQEYQYRLIESALKDDSELEQFLLDNIKVS